MLKLLPLHNFILILFRSSFDFTQPFKSPVNSERVEAVVKKAKETMVGRTNVTELEINVTVLTKMRWRFDNDKRNFFEPVAK